MRNFIKILFIFLSMNNIFASENYNFYKKHPWEEEISHTKSLLTKMTLTARDKRYLTSIWQKIKIQSPQLAVEENELGENGLHLLMTFAPPDLVKSIIETLLLSPSILLKALAHGVKTSDHMVDIYTEHRSYLYDYMGSSNSMVPLLLNFDPFFVLQVVNSLHDSFPKETRRLLIQPNEPCGDSSTKVLFESMAEQSEMTNHHFALASFLYSVLSQDDLDVEYPSASTSGSVHFFLMNILESNRMTFKEFMEFFERYELWREPLLTVTNSCCKDAKIQAGLA